MFGYRLPSLSARFLIGYCFVSRDNLQIKCVFVLSVPPHSRISDRKYSTRRFCGVVVLYLCLSVKGPNSVY